MLRQQKHGEDGDHGPEDIVQLTGDHRIGGKSERDHAFLDDSNQRDEEEMMGVVDPPPGPGREGIVQAVRRLLRRLQREEKNRRKSRQRRENDRLPEADPPHVYPPNSMEGERIPGDAFMMERNWSARSGSTGRTSRLHASAWSGEGMRAASTGAA